MKYPLLKTSRNILFLAGSLVWQMTANSQWKAGVEQYIYTGMPVSEAITPVFHIQTENNLYAEFRYNYEAAKTLSLYGGGTFTGGAGLEYTITPMIGLSTGRFTGVSFAVNTDAQWKNFFFSSQMQYSMDVRKNDSAEIKNDSKNFIFNWSEIGFDITDNLYTGFAIQYTVQGGINEFRPGFLTGLSFNKLQIPFYVFSPFHPDCYFVAGIIYEISFKKKK